MPGTWDDTTTKWDDPTTIWDAPGGVTPPAVLTQNVRGRPVVEIAPGYGPLDDPVVWLDITNRLREEGVRIQRGRQNKLQRFNAGTLDAVLDNRDGYFNPLNPSSPLYGLIAPEMPVRLSLEYPWLPGLVPNFDLSNGTTGWGLYGASATVSTAAPGYMAPLGARWASTATTGANAGLVSPPAPVAAGTRYGASIRVWHNLGAAKYFSASIRWYSDSGGTTMLSEDTLGGVSVATGNKPSRIGDAKTAPSSAVSARVCVYLGNQQNGQVFMAGAPVIAAASQSVMESQFLGFVDSWDQEDDTLFNATLPLKATDGFKTLGNYVFFKSDYPEYVESLPNVSAYWRLQELDAATPAADEMDGTLAHSFPGHYASNATMGDSGAIPGDASTSVGNDDRGGVMFTNNLISDMVTKWGINGYWLAFLYKYNGNGTPADFTTLFEFGDYNDPNVPGGRISMAIIPATGVTIAGTGITVPGGHLRYFLASENPLSQQTLWVSNARFDDGNWNHIVITSTGGIYLNGAPMALYPPLIGKTNEQGVLFDPGIASILGGGSSIGAWQWGMPVHAPTCGVNGDLQELAVGAGDLTPTQIQTLWNKSIGRWNLHLPGQRINAVLDLLDWPMSRRNIDPGHTVLAPADSGITKSNALQHLQDVEATDAGDLFIDRKGTLTYLDVNTLNSPTFRAPVATFANTAVGLVPYSKVALGLNEDSQYTEAQITPNSGNQIFVDADSATIQRYGVLQYSLSTLHANDGDALLLGQWVIQEFSQPRARFTEVDIELLNDETTWETAATLDLEQYITLQWKPPGVAAQSVTCWIEGVNHEITRDNWTVAYTLFTPTAVANYLYLDDPVNGLLDTGRLSY